jgi:hypothetical protein
MSLLVKVSTLEQFNQLDRLLTQWTVEGEQQKAMTMNTMLSKCWFQLYERMLENGNFVDEFVKMFANRQPLLLEEKVRSKKILDGHNF